MISLAWNAILLRRLCVLKVRIESAKLGYLDNTFLKEVYYALSMWLQCMTQVTMSRQGGKRTCGHSFFGRTGANVVNAWRIFTPLRRSWGKCEVFHCLSLKEYSLWNFPLSAPGEGSFSVQQCAFGCETSSPNSLAKQQEVTNASTNWALRETIWVMSVKWDIWRFPFLVRQRLVVWLFCRCLPSRHFAHWLFTCSSLERFLWFSVDPRHSVWSDLPTAEMQAVQVFVFLCQRKARRYFFGQYCLWLIWLI